jgi:hypothetical protein
VVQMIQRGRRAARSLEVLEMVPRMCAGSYDSFRRA